MLQKHSYLTVPWPLEFELLFPSVQPVIVEIGFGNGDYLVNLAQTRPDSNVLGFEISSQSLDRAERKIEMQGLRNVRPIHTPAETALAHLLEPETVHEFHINYPDPWFKKKHHRRRLINRDTVALLTSRLVQGGTLHLATDILEYAEMAHEILSHSPGLDNSLDSAWSNQVDGRFPTKYELRAFREGRHSHFLLYRRNRYPIRHQAVIKELEMPHLFLRSPYDASELVERFSVSRSRHGDVHIAILHAYADAKRDAAVFEVVVEEPTIEQHTMILLTARDQPNEYIVKMTSLGHARPTYGMHRAVAAVGEWIAKQHVAAAIVERKLRD